MGLKRHLMRQKERRSVRIVFSQFWLHCLVQFVDRVHNLWIGGLFRWKCRQLNWDCFTLALSCLSGRFDSIVRVQAGHRKWRAIGKGVSEVLSEMKSKVESLIRLLNSHYLIHWEVHLQFTMNRAQLHRNRIFKWFLRRCVPVGHLL